MFSLALAHEVHFDTKILVTCQKVRQANFSSVLLSLRTFYKRCVPWESKQRFNCERRRFAYKKNKLSHSVTISDKTPFTNKVGGGGGVSDIKSLLVIYYQPFDRLMAYELFMSFSIQIQCSYYLVHTL